ncbi:prohead protease/major capsid protein fusion protein [Magnetofaba australis]|uniref:Putative peptidase U37 n=1 Tax=Magnetofaba australis IT-1 TaxID=1434232 RepID=A0A1Y2KBQ9_9PROT|nr:prohead protease/major capsid protein fusion protein [Magnetofaba australis]OSM07358.1 putative peptidase U37 [Magnetofaba australis IT-1]
MSKQTVDLPMQVRAAAFAPESVDAEKRTIELVWSTGAAVRRRDSRSGKPYEEQLSLDARHVNLNRLNGGAPLLDSHRAWNLGDVIGVVERAWINDGSNGPEGRALVRFSEREEIEPLWRDIQSGVIRNVSVGYAVRSYEITEAEGEIPIWRAVDWEPMELSAVPVGADAGAGFRSGDSLNTPCELIRESGGDMETEVEEAAADPVAEEKTRQDPGLDPKALAQEAVAVERQRIGSIYDAQSKLGLERSFADNLVQRGVELDEARSQMIDAMASRDAQTQIRNHQVMAGQQDERETRKLGVETALLHRFDPTAHEMSEPAREWRGMTLLEMARSFLEAEGGSTRGLSRDEVATRALATSSDFPLILANVANKTLRNAYDSAPRTFHPFCRQVTASDFKAMHRVQLGEAPALEKVNESGEYKRGPLGEAQESYRVETYGKIISISRQVLINDDLDAFTRIPQLFGVAAANLESDVVWSVITANPKMADNKALFHADHKNLAGTPAALSVAAIGKGRTDMAKQVGLDGKTVINVRPNYLLVPAALETSAEQLLAQNLVPAKTADVVPQSMRTLSVISEPRLDAVSETAWYLVANPNQIDTIEYAYLEGQNGVYIETRVGFDVDGVEIKARLDFGAKAIDWRGFHKNAGA